jgi:hypothetical protein
MDTDKRQHGGLGATHAPTGPGMPGPYDLEIYIRDPFYDLLIPYL